MSDLVRTFDPAENQGGTSAEGQIQNAYERLLMRGEEDKAEELRETDPVASQLTKAKEVREYDPVHDQPYNRSRILVKKVYETLQDLERTDEAEDLRYRDSLAEQKKRAIEIKSELEESDPEAYERIKI